MITPTRLINGVALTASLATYYTVPSTVLSATAKQLVVCNTDSVSHTFTYEVIPSGGTAGVAATMFSSVTLQPHQTSIFGLTDVMAVGTFIQASADTAAVVSLTLSGMVNT